MKTHTLSNGAKFKALLIAGYVRLRAGYSIGHLNGYVTEATRKEWLEVADLLEAKGQPHRGRRGDHGVVMMAYQLIGAGYTPTQAARYALADRQWHAEFEGQRSKKIRADLQREYDAGLTDRMRSIASKDAQRVAAHAKKLKGTLAIK